MLFYWDLNISATAEKLCSSLDFGRIKAISRGLRCYFLFLTEYQVSLKKYMLHIFKTCANTKVPATLVEKAFF